MDRKQNAMLKHLQELLFKALCTGKYSNPSRNSFKAKALLFYKMTQEKKGLKAVALKQAKLLRMWANYFL